ncbi:MAG: energy transducer TonB [Bacteroidales bacterium]|jgi:protein TonB|nr:energy transducer TonB [Bacteroidales bacterium]MCR5361527.1 energy transducer TonB [Bacteroidales bacterium]
MEIKKDPKVNLESRKTTYVLTGLVGILAILFVGLEWANTSRRISSIAARNDVVEEEEEIVMTVQNNTPPPPPPPPMPDVIEQLTVVEDDVEIEEIEMQSLEDDNNTVVEVVDLSADSGPSEEEETEGNQIFTVVEQQPEFPGGEAALMAYIKKNLKYPAFAAENGIQGRVTLSFTVEKDGSIANIEVMRSPAEELSKEAIRVVQSMPKWKPGKQRGKAVRVKYVLPVTFRLQ